MNTTSPDANTFQSLVFKVCEHHYNTESLEGVCGHFGKSETVAHEWSLSLECLSGLAQI